jgi:transposase
MICPCCGQARQPIGEEVTEELDYVPASFVVRQHVRIKYACKHCQEGVAIADLPARPIEKGRPGPGLLANVLTSKYGDHLPLHRQEGIWKRHGVHITRSTMCDWVRDCAYLLSPIVRYMQTIILQSKKIHTDDTPVPVQDGSRKQTRKGYLWTYIGDKNDVVFDYTPTHSRDGPVAFLGDYSGYIHADAYKGYDIFFKKGNATEVACWAHTRRKFYDCLTTDLRRAHIMLAMIGRLYDVERRAKEEDLDAIALRELRQEQSKPVLEEISGCLDDWSIEVLPKSPIGQAVGYARGQWIALNQYIDDGDLAIDNNLAERVLRTVAIGRRNWLFAGSDAGAERAAIIYSLIASCKLFAIDPFAYLRDVLDRISTHPASRIAELTPSGWKRYSIAGN